jgi:hypothetical protein
VADWWRYARTAFGSRDRLDGADVSGGLAGAVAQGPQAEKGGKDFHDFSQFNHGGSPR